MTGASAFSFQGATPSPPAAPATPTQVQSAPSGQNAQGEQGGQRQRRQNAPGGEGGQGGQGGRGGMGGFGGGGGGGRGMGGFAQIMNRYKAEFLRRDIQLFKEQLEFDAGQMAIVEVLINDYDFAFNPASEASRTKVEQAAGRMFQGFFGGDMREKMRTMRDTLQQDIAALEVENGGPLTDEARQKLTTDFRSKMGAELAAERKATGADLETKAIMQEILDEITRWSAERAAFRKVVVDGIQTTLNPEQTVNWPKFERFLRREKSMDNAVLSGEATNLLVVMDEAGVSQPSIDSSAKTLDDYELQLDNALVARDEFIERSDPKLMRAVLDADVAGGKAIAERQIALRKAVRDVNDQYRTMIVGVMPAEDGAKFNQAALTAAFRRTYRATQVQEAFAKVLEMSDLSAETSGAATNLQITYLAELAGCNDRIVAATRKQEPERRLEEIERVIGMMSGTSFAMGMRGPQGDGTPDPVGVLEDSRDEMDKRYLEQLKGLLTPDQQALLPQPRNRGRGGNGGNNFGSGKIADMPEQFQAGAKKADKNNDGTLDDTERGEFFRSMREQGGMGGQGGRGGQGGQGGQGTTTN